MRFRPIMMTTMAALMGTLPIALGARRRRRVAPAARHRGRRRPARSRSSITLYVTPVVYTYMDARQPRRGAWLSQLWQEERDERSCRRRRRRYCRRSRVSSRSRVGTRRTEFQKQQLPRRARRRRETQRKTEKGPLLFFVSSAFLRVSAPSAPKVLPYRFGAKTSTANVKLRPSFGLKRADADHLPSHFLAAIIPDRDDDRIFPRLADVGMMDRALDLEREKVGAATARAAAPGSKRRYFLHAGQMLGLSRIVARQ